jgi:hypothetical protein
LLPVTALAAALLLFGEADGWPFALVLLAPAGVAATGVDVGP